MRIVAALFFFNLAAFAQNPSAVSSAQAACGPAGVRFDVKVDDSRHTVAEPQAGKALVYVIQDIGVVQCVGACITTKVGLDGGWIGANHHNSYFSFAVDPGEHHLCVQWQSHFGYLSAMTGLAHFTAESGKIYYFRTRASGDKTQAFLDLDPIDSDQGRYLVALYPVSVSHPKK